jgi:hypothetical protein
LADGIAHDFNNILTVIMGSASSAPSECPSCEHSRVVLESADRAAYLTKQLLAYADKGSVVVKVSATGRLRTRPSGAAVPASCRRHPING